MQTIRFLQKDFKISIRLNRSDISNKNISSTASLILKIIESNSVIYLALCDYFPLQIKSQRLSVEDKIESLEVGRKVVTRERTEAPPS